MLPALASWLVSSDQEGLFLTAVKLKLAAGVAQAGVEGRGGVGGVVLGFDVDLGVISVTAEADVMLSDDVSNRLIENKTGPSTDPCGTAHVTAASSDRHQNQSRFRAVRWPETRLENFAKFIFRQVRLELRVRNILWPFSKAPIVGRSKFG